MPIQSKSSETGNARQAMSTAADEIKKDLDSLQSDVAHLASNVGKASTEKARRAMSYVNEQMGSLKETSANAVGQIEDTIRSNPGQSVTIAFFAGLLVSFLFSRK